MLSSVLHKLVMTEQLIINDQPVLPKVPRMPLCCLISLLYRKIVHALFPVIFPKFICNNKII